MQNIKAIIFDFGGVIFNIDFVSMNNAFSNLGVKHFEKIYSQKSADPLFQHLEEGKINEEEFYNAFRKFVNLQLADQQIKTAWNALLAGYRKNALQTLKRIKHKYALYLLSNTNSIHVQAFNKMYKEEVGEGSLEDYFDKVYYSHKIGYRKPDVQAYKYVLEENNLCPDETLFIDDSIQNIEAAKTLGLQTIFLKNGQQIEDFGLLDN